MKYTEGDAGCYVNGARGIYATDAIVDFARDHGATITRSCKCDHHRSYFDSEFASCEWSVEYEDEATEFMETNYPVEGHYWGRADWSGDWGLWQCETE